MAGFVAVDGRHGSSMLVPERNEAPTEPAWEALGAFLRANVPTAGGSSKEVAQSRNRKAEGR